MLTCFAVSKYYAMGSVIQFPKKTKKAKHKIEDFLVEKLPKHEQYCDVGNSRFTCAGCGQTSNFSFQGIIFKACTFYCGHCGIGYKMTNPLFVMKKDSKSQ
jgi:hypothetical protein